MRLGTITSRRALMEREKAMDAARNPGVSKFGDCLVNINSKSDRVLNTSIRKINSEIRRMEIRINQKMKHFVKNSTVLNHDPMILVERPPSPDIVKRAKTLAEYDGSSEFPVEDPNKPNYMQQLRSKTRTPSTLTTIDAFVVKNSKKKNVWEGAVTEKEPPQFLSTVRPYAKLTRREISDLQKGYEFHKPRLENEAVVSDNEREKKSAKRPAKQSGESGESDLDEEISPFITQMADVRKKRTTPRKEHTIAEIHMKSTKSPLFALENSQSPVQLETEHDKTVRFSSPVVLSEPGSRKPKRKLKTKATKVSY